MLFWIMLSFILICIVFFNIKKENRYITEAYVFILWFISSFRYMIGPDYEMYTDIYDEYGYIFDYIQVEPFFEILVRFLNEMGCTYQMLFLIYSIISIYGIYYGARNFFEKEYCIMIFMGIFTFDVHLYWLSLSGIRQFSAMAVFFLSSSWLIKDRKIFSYIGQMLTLIMHYSSLLLIVSSFLKYKRMSLEKNALFFLCAWIAGVLNFFPNLLISTVGSFDNEWNKYMGYMESLMNGVNYIVNPFTVLLCFVYMMFLYYYRNINIDYKIEYALRLSLWYIILSILVSYDIDNLSAKDMINRIPLLFVPYFAVVITDFLSRVYNDRKVCFVMIIMVCYSLFFIRTLSLYDHNQEGMSLPSRSNANIEYEMNFKLFK